VMLMMLLLWFEVTVVIEWLKGWTRHRQVLLVFVTVWLGMMLPSGCQRGVNNIYNVNLIEIRGEESTCQI
jgi:hypothetical protein